MLQHGLCQENLVEVALPRWKLTRRQFVSSKGTLWFLMFVAGRVRCPCFSLFHLTSEIFLCEAALDG